MLNMHSAPNSLSASDIKVRCLRIMDKIAKQIGVSESTYCS